MLSRWLFTRFVFFMLIEKWSPWRNLVDYIEPYANFTFSSFSLKLLNRLQSDLVEKLVRKFWQSCTKLLISKYHNETQFYQKNPGERLQAPRSLWFGYQLPVYQNFEFLHNRGHIQNFYLHFSLQLHEGIIRSLLNSLDMITFTLSPPFKVLR